MSAVQGLRDRVGFGQRLLRTAGSVAELFRPSPVGALGVAAAPAAVAPSRTEALLRRHVAAHGAVGSVLEIGCGAGLRDWFGPAVRQARVAANDGDAILDALRDLPGASFDLVYSVDRLELSRSPWKLAEEIRRLLRPGGITFHATVFTTRYQPQPEDFFRFTPDGLRSLFEGLDCLTAEFDATERPRDRRRRTCGDIFSSSREGWRVHYCGRKAAR